MQKRNPRAVGRVGAVAVLLGASIALAGPAAVPASAQRSGEVVQLSLEGVVDPFVADYLEGEIRDAGDAGAAAVVITIDTPGGLSSSTRQITEAVLNARVPVITYVSPAGARAASAGSFVLLSGNIAAMAPGTNVGAATPVGLSGAVASDKATNDAAASIVSIAETRGRNAEVAETFVTEAISISAEQALADDVIDLIAPTTEGLLDEVDGMTVTVGDGGEVTLATAGAPVTAIEMSPFAGLLHDLLDPQLAFVFFWLGLALIVLELLVPGHIFSGTIGTILLILSIVSFGLLPIQLIGVLLLIASIVLFAIEISAPGLGVWGVLGVIALVAGGLLLYDPSSGTSVSPWVLVPVAAAMALFFGVVVGKVMAVRKMPPSQGPEAIIGREGVALGTGVTAGGGIVRVQAEEWQAVSTGAIAPGRTVRVTRLDGLVLTVEPVNDEHGSAAPPAPTEEGGHR
jgi:membrane-bound serine protease (ClpP class)